MAAIGVAEGPVRPIGCAPIYKIPQTRWTTRLTVQIIMYVLFVAISMAAGALMPWFLELFYGWRIGAGNSLYKMYSEGQGYVYDNNNTYAFCPKHTRYSYDPLQRGYPAPPLAPQNGHLYDAWYHKEVVLKGVNWFGFNNEQGMVDGLWAGGSSAATDFQAIVYELKLLGFNTVRLPFTFDMLKKQGLKQVQKCTSSTKSAWAQRATDPDILPQPEYAGVPEPSVYLDVPVTSRHLCNTYLPANNTASIERLLWTVQYLVANGFYVVLDYHPDPTDTLALDVENFARAWTYTWAAVACLPNFASDIRGRLLLDLLNEPDKVGTTGLGWTRSGTFPGLDELYLTTMDTIESITPNDALFMVQGSVRSKSIVGGGRQNKLGLSAGDGFVSSTTTISKYDLTDPRGFFNELLKRPYKTRILLAPHLYGPSVSGVPAAQASELSAKLDSSWGVLATDGYCHVNECMRLPVVAGEMGSQLQSNDDLSYYDKIAQYTQLGNAVDSSESPLVGWIWWAYNANSAGTGGLTTDDWQDLLWPKIRYLRDHYGLNPWYTDPAAFTKNAEAEKADALTARAAADAAAQSAAAAANPSSTNLTNLSVVRFGAAATANAAADATGAGQLDVPAVVEYLPAEGSAATPSAAATVADPSPATLAAPHVVALAPTAAPVPPPVQPVSAAATVPTAQTPGTAPAMGPTVVQQATTVPSSAQPAAAPPAIGLAPKAAPVPPPVQPLSAARVPTAPTPAAVPAVDSAVVLQASTVSSTAAPAAATPGTAAAPVPVTQPPAVPVATAGWVPDTWDTAGKPSDLIAQESLASLETDAVVVSANQPASLRTATRPQVMEKLESARSLLAESQLPSVPDMGESGQPGLHAADAVSAAEKAAATAAQHQASRHIAATTRLLVRSGNGARL